MATLFQQPVVPVFNGIGYPAGAAKVYFYYTGTTTLAPIYADGILSTPLSNPVIANAFGFLPNVYLNPSITYRIRATDFAGASIGYDIDPYLSTGYASVSSRTDMANLSSPIVGQPVLLTEAGREGWFTTYGGTSNQVDPSQAIVVPSNKGNFYFRRMFEGDAVFAHWYGAKGDGATDDTDAIVAAYSSGYLAKLIGKTYLVRPNVIKLNQTGMGLEGVGEFLRDGTGTRLLCNSPTGTIVQVGPDAFPGSINAMPFWLKAMNIYATRNQGPLLTDDCNAWLVQYCVHSRVEHTGANESIIGYRVRGVVDTHVAANYAKRDTQAPSGSDKYRGFYFDGHANIGAAGSNASLYANDERNRSELTTNIANSIALEVDAGFTDQWCKIEASGPHSVGVSVSGITTGTSADAQNNTDFKLDACVIDQTTTLAYSLQDINQDGSIEILAPYAGPGAGAVMQAARCGTIRISGGQWRALYTQSDTVLADTCKSFVLNETSIVDGTADIVALQNCAVAKITPLITNYGRATTGAAVRLIQGNKNVNVTPLIEGGPNAFGLGVQLSGTTNVKNRIDVTGIDGACLPTNGTLQVNGTAITARNSTPDAQGNVFDGAF